jgi:hypothetical protein
MHALMRARPFATLVSGGSAGLYASHLPTVLRTMDHTVSLNAISLALIHIVTILPTLAPLASRPPIGHREPATAQVAPESLISARSLLSRWTPPSASRNSDRAVRPLAGKGNDPGDGLVFGGLLTLAIGRRLGRRRPDLAGPRKGNRG